MRNLIDLLQAIKIGRPENKNLKSENEKWIN